MMAKIIDRLEFRMQNCLTKCITSIGGYILGSWKDFVILNIVILSVLVIVHADTSSKSRRYCEGVRMIVWENGATVETG